MTTLLSSQYTEWPVASLEDNGYQAHCQKLLQESKRPNDGWRKFSLNIPKSKTEDHRERTSCKGDEAHAIKRKPEFKDQGLGRDGKRAKLAGSGLIDHPLPQENMQKKDETCGKLPCRRDLSVLLVEDDDSTRQIVGALLQNCGYKVTFAANGLQAWKLLEDPSSHIDLVLTEVTMPGMSGISLLTRLTHHEAYKRIPVIMMSPHDSIKVVFRCLSKGAADFLVKPVRKNELKNLWQHVWRRSQSSSGSGGESTSQIGTAKLQKDYFISGEAVNSENSDANSARHSDDGSTTQSLCIRKLDEQEHSSFHAAKENTIQIPIETCSDEIGYNDGHDEKKNISNGEQLATLFKNMENRDHIFQPTATRFLVPSLEHGRHCEGQTNSSLSNSTKAIDLIGTVASQENGSKLSDYHHAPAKQRFSSASSLLTLELSLKRPHDARDESRSITNHVVFQSGGSAFSRYHGGGDLHHSIDGMALQQAEPVVHTGQALPNTRAENFHQQSDEHTGSDSVMVDDFVKDDSPSLAESSMQNSKSTVAFSMPQPVMLTYYGSPTFGEGMHQVYFASQLTRESFDQKSTDHSPYFNHAHHRSHQHGDNYNYHFQYHHHQGEHISPNGNVLMSDASRGRSSSLTDFNKGQGSSVNGSATGSNTNGSNGYNGNVNMDFTNDGTSARLGVDGNHGVVDVEQGRSARREAALNKFRQKRKDRCFEKKVRYQSRKKLAEQRPRVRGQFVSQAIYDSSKADVAVMQFREQNIPFHKFIGFLFKMDLFMCCRI